jgi:hypothetical protein
MFAFWDGNIEFSMKSEYEYVLNCIVKGFFRGLNYEKDGEKIKITTKQNGYIHRFNTCYFPDLLLFIKKYGVIEHVDLKFKANPNELMFESSDGKLVFENGEFFCEYKQIKKENFKEVEKEELIKLLEKYPVNKGGVVGILGAFHWYDFFGITKAYIKGWFIDRAVADIKKGKGIRKNVQLFSKQTNYDFEFKGEEIKVIISNIHKEKIVVGISGYYKGETLEEKFPEQNMFTKQEYEKEDKRKIIFDLDKGEKSEFPLIPAFLKYKAGYFKLKEGCIIMPDGVIVNGCSQCIHRVNTITGRTCKVCDPEIVKLKS